MSLHRDSEQLELALFPGVPWNGRSPRVLTRAQLGVIFTARAESHAVEMHPEQLMLFPVGGTGKREKVPWVYQGAPSLLPLLNREGG